MSAPAMGVFRGSEFTPSESVAVLTD